MKFFIDDGLQLTRTLKHGEEKEPLRQDSGEPHTITFRPLTGMEKSSLVLQAEVAGEGKGSSDVYLDSLCTKLAEHLISWTFTCDPNIKSLQQMTDVPFGALFRAMLAADVEDIAGN